MSPFSAKTTKIATPRAHSKLANARAMGENFFQAFSPGSTIGASQEGLWKDNRKCQQ
jgi:hypothetical protein